MRVNREALLGALELLTPGLAARENIAQSSCVVFNNGRVQTFNEEILATIDSPIPNLVGAIRAKPFLDLLSKMQDDTDVEVEAKETDDKDGKKVYELLVKGQNGKRRSGLRMEAEVMLPVEVVDIPKQWRDLNPDFCEAISVVYECAGAERESKFALTCVHINPHFVEATDRTQIARFPIELDLQQPILVRSESIKRILGCDMTQFSETESWIHFKNSKGLILSLRRFVDGYPDLNAFLNTDGSQKTTLPGALEEIVDRAGVFSGDLKSGSQVTVRLTRDYIQIDGEGASGWYKERKQSSYAGEPIIFRVNSNLLVSVSKKSLECHIGSRTLCVDTGKFKYVTCLGQPKDESKKKDEAKS